jgi:hypothetical protein
MPREWKLHSPVAIFAAPAPFPILSTSTSRSADQMNDETDRSQQKQDTLFGKFERRDMND